MIVILLSVLLISYYLVYLTVEPNTDNFLVYWSGVPIGQYNPLGINSGYNDHTNFPFDNMRIGQTTNMSYDLRGDPLQIPKYPFAWNYSTLTPIYQNPL